jgi:hypothetical protein
MQLLTHVAATSSADSSTNTTPPEFANPTGWHSAELRRRVRVMKRGWVCRLLSSRKWVRLETASEEAYQCRRCGKRRFGRQQKDFDYTSLAGGGGGPVG